MTAAHIPLVDLAAQHREVADDIDRGLSRVIENTAFILGPDVKLFEQEFADFCGIKHCVGVANGTDALEVALRALGIGAGDEVIVPVNSFIATAFAVARAGATPVFVDADPVYHLLDVDKTAERITPRTRAIIPVHLYGQFAPMERFQKIAKEAGITLIEDAAQAQGATRNGLGIGAASAVAGTSFYPGKNLGAYGDAGAVVTASDDLAKKLRAQGNYGSDVKYYHREMGFNSRLDTLQAVVLRAKLRRLARWNEARRDAAARYDAWLRDVPCVVTPATLAGNEHIFHLYVIRVPRRDEVLRTLQQAGIGAAIHYPVPMHLQEAFAWLGHKRGHFPVAEKAAGEILSLPLFPQITPEQQERVVDVLRGAVGQGS
jgi:dTDP-4-amino-4,6-dideoxygalactose transaminase